MPKKLHDAYRVAKDGSPTFDKLFAAAQSLQKHRVTFHTLTVVNRLNASLLDVYPFLRSELCPHEMQFIPHPGSPDSVVTDSSVDPDDRGYFLSKVWEVQICIYHDFCSKGVALEHDGSLYSCDHYVYPEYRLGNIRETSSAQMVFSEEQRKLASRRARP